MSTSNVYLAVFLGSPAGRAAWEALPEAERKSREREGIAAWKAWMDQHQAAIVEMGGPLGKTKKVSRSGIEDTRNHLGAFSVLRAESHEAAAKMFVNHPAFHAIPRRVGRDHAGDADTGRVSEESSCRAGSSRRPFFVHCRGERSDPPAESRPFRSCSIACSASRLTNRGSMPSSPCLRLKPFRRRWRRRLKSMKGAGAARCTVFRLPSKICLTRPV